MSQNIKKSEEEQIYKFKDVEISAEKPTWQHPNVWLREKKNTHWLEEESTKNSRQAKARE